MYLFLVFACSCTLSGRVGGLPCEWHAALWLLDRGRETHARRNNEIIKSNLKSQKDKTSEHG